MKKHLSTVFSTAALAMAMGVGGDAAAQATWNFGAPCNVATCSAGGVTATVAGYDATSASSAYVLGALTNQGGSGIGYTSTIETSPGSPDHAFDNRSGESGSTAAVEMMLISFGTSKVALTTIALGWSNTDADVSVLRWDGAGAPTAAGTSLSSAGWTLISSKDVDGSASPTNTAGGSFVLSSGVGANAANTKVSSWWMVSTYFGATVASATGAALGGLDSGANDFFKILSFTGNICVGTVTGGSTGTAGTAGAGNGGICGPGSITGVPEPTSLALLVAAAVGGLATRRRWLKRG
jgi:hypothetical protein